LFFCEECKKRVFAYNHGAGRCVIPIGRHSIMNGVFFRAADASKPKRVKAFAKDLVRSFFLSDPVWEHHRAYLGRIVACLPVPPGAIPIAAYIEHARTLSADRDAVFAALVSAVTKRSH
jgi:hypothetical protein